MNFDSIRAWYAVSPVKRGVITVIVLGAVFVLGQAILGNISF